MKRLRLGWRVTFKLAAVVLLLTSLPAVAQTCGGAKPGTTNAETTVYESQPTFSSGSGWTLSKVLVTLPPRTSITVCDVVSIGSVFSKQTWLKIQFDAKIGWVYAGSVTVGGIGKADKLINRDFLSIFIATAHAESTGPPVMTPTPSLWPIYLVMFLAVCTGMAAKGLFDWLQQDRAIDKGYRRETIKAWLISPIVFASALQLGDFSLETTAKFVLLLCWAFQNGFFWQTVLVKADPTK